ncbi:MAG: serine/threonine protein kinase [Planctomycetaceae bacterium]|nr:serine/threonine protein kinase [Planctomycetaceae bacterium]
MSSTTTFFERVRNSGLIELEKLKLFAVSLHDGKRLDLESSNNVDAVSPVNWREMAGFKQLSPLDRFLAKELVRLRWLNTWQVSQLIEGRTKFSLGDFQIRDALGYGGYSHVFLGQSRTTSELVAIKVFQASRTDPKEFSKFLREVTLQKSLDHRNIVRLLTHGYEGNVDYLVFEYMRGGDVRKRLRQEVQLPVLQAIRIVVDTAGGLACLHQRGMIHRDVKPANILLDETGNAKLGDMGLVGFLGDKTKNDPRFGKLVGTADYMAPDQICNPREPSVQWDIYSLGCTFYQMVTGIVPFPKGDSREKVLAHLKSEIVDPRVFRPDLPHDVARFLLEMTAKDPMQRTKNAKEIVAKLKSFLPSGKSRIQSHLEEWTERPEHKTIDPETLKRLFDFSDRATLSQILPQTTAQIIVAQESSPPEKSKNKGDAAFEKINLDAVKNIPVEKEIYAVRGEQSSTKMPFEFEIPVKVVDEEPPAQSDQKTPKIPPDIRV